MNPFRSAHRLSGFTAGIGSHGPSGSLNQLIHLQPRSPWLSRWHSPPHRARRSLAASEQPSILSQARTPPRGSLAANVGRRLSYSTGPAPEAPCPPSPPASSRVKKKISPSFRAGPFRGALLSSPPPLPSAHPSPPSPSQHQYSPSQLRQALKPTPSRSALHFPHSQTIKNHLEELLYPLEFSEQLACRIVSAKNLVKSHASLHALEQSTPGGVGFAMLGEHNTKLSFIGRRTMHFALCNFLVHAPLLAPLKSPGVRLSGAVVEDALLTKFVLGQYVGHQWELEKAMRWRELEEPAGGGERSQGTGLWTARGHVVEAIVGGVMAQHGARLGLAVFNSLVLPHLAFRLDPAFLPAIHAVQAHDRELGQPEAGLVDWQKLDLTPYAVANEVQASEELDKPRLRRAVG